MFHQGGRSAGGSAAKALAAAVAVCLLPALLSGCKIRAPKIHLKDVTVASVSLTRMDLNLDFLIENPNDLQARVYGFEYSLEVQGQPAVGGKMPPPVPPLPPKGRQTYRAPVSIDYARFGRLFSELQAGKAIPCRVSCGVTFNVLGLPLPVKFGKDITLPFFRDLSWELREARWRASPPGVELVFDVTNPNSEAAKVTGLAGELVLDGRPAAAVSQALSTELPKAATTRLTVAVDLAGLEAETVRAGLERRCELIFRGRFNLAPPRMIRKALPWMKENK